MAFFNNWWGGIRGNVSNLQKSGIEKVWESSKTQGTILGSVIPWPKKPDIDICHCSLRFCVPVDAEQLNQSCVAAECGMRPFHLLLGHCTPVQTCKTMTFKLILFNSDSTIRGAYSIVAYALLTGDVTYCVMKPDRNKLDSVRNLTWSDQSSC